MSRKDANDPETLKLPDFLFLLLLLFFSVFLRLYLQEGFELNDDEASSVLLAVRSLPGIVHVLTMDNIPPLYYFLLHFWIGIFGMDETSVRCLSILFGASLVLLVYLILRQEASRATAMIGSIMSAVSPITLYYSFVVRGYALLALLAVFTIYFLLRSLREGGTRNWALYGTGMILTLYTHTLAWFLAPVALVSFFTIPGSRKSFIVTHLVIVTAYLPWFFVFLRQMENRYTVAWMRGVWENENHWLIIPRTFHRFSAIGFPPLGFKSVGLIFFFLFLIGKAVLHKEGPWKIHRSGMPFFWMLFIPLILTWLYSFITPIYFVGRSDFYVYPAFCILTALGIESFRLKKVKWLLGGTIITLYAYYAVTSPMFEKPAEKAFVEDNIKPILRKSRPGDMVVFTNRSRSRGEYYLLKEGGPGRRFRIFSYPESMGGRPGIYMDKDAERDREYLEKEARKIAIYFRKLLPRKNQMWLFYYPSGVNRYLLDALNIGIPSKWRASGKNRGRIFVISRIDQS